MDDEGLRINRFLASAGLGSRRSCEELVRAGRVQVDGETVESLGARVGPGQVVRVDGRIVHAARHTAVLALNKPAGYHSTARDSDGRPVAIDLVRPQFSGHIFSVGRLDAASTGLLLFTNDGELAQRLMRPEHAIEREYLVETATPVDEERLREFTAGLSIRGVPYRLTRYRIHSRRRITLVLTEGRNREIRRVFEHWRIPVNRLHRTRFGPVRLARLPSGQVRRLTPKEIAELDAASRLPVPHGSRRSSQRPQRRPR